MVLASKGSPKSAGDSHDQTTLIEVFENGTLMGAVVSESSSSVPGIGESPNSSSVITLTSEMLNLNAFGADTNSLVTSANNTSLSSAEACSSSLAVDAAANNLSSISGVLSQAEYLNSSDTCSSTLESSTRRNSKRSTSRRKLKKCRPAEIFVNPFPPPYATIYVDAGSAAVGGLSLQQNGAAVATTTVVPTATGYQNPMGSFTNAHLAVQVPVIRRSLPEPDSKKCCTNWFTRPSLPLVIGILALGGVACTLGGIVLGSTGLIEHSTQYLSAALLMIGIGVSMLVISGAIWRLSIPDDTDSFQCFRPSFDTCRNCNSPYCANRFLTGAYFYPEFQHRQPPPSYMTTLQEYRLLVPDQMNEANSDNQRIQSPPPSYRSNSTNTLNASHHELDQTRSIAENITNELQANEKETTDGS